MRAPSTSTVFFVSGCSVIGSLSINGRVWMTMPRDWVERKWIRPYESSNALHHLRPATMPGILRHRCRADLAGVVEGRRPSARLYFAPSAGKHERHTDTVR